METTLILLKTRTYSTKLRINYAFQKSREVFRVAKFLKWDFNYYTVLL